MSAPMIPPISIPVQDRPRSYHCAGQVANDRRDTQGSSSTSACSADRSADELWSPNQDMSLSARASLASHKSNESVTRLDRAGVGTRLIGIARAVYFTRSNARQAHVRTFGAPDWAIAIPDTDRRAFEGLARWDNGRGPEYQANHRPLYGSQPTPSPSRSRCGP